MAVKVGINGFGRIGRNVLRTALADKNLDFVAVNDLTDPQTLAHLLKYDSILGNLPNTITAGADSISIDGKVIKVFKEKDPAALPWDSVGAQVVIESTGRFTDATDAKKHLRGSEKRRPDRRPRRKRRQVRSGEAPHCLQRLLHHQLSRSHRQGGQ
jgi:glyceraldehyde 3-phosphate dehydrogenase